MFFLLTAFLALPSVRAEAQDELYFGIVPLEADAGRLSPLGTGENKFFETVVCLDTSSDVLVGKLEGCEIVVLFELRIQAEVERVFGHNRLRG